MSSGLMVPRDRVPNVDRFSHPDPGFKGWSGRYYRDNKKRSGSLYRGEIRSGFKRFHWLVHPEG